MDLLFQRYASPFLFLDGMIQTGRFSEFVVEFISALNTDKENSTRWEFYLHKVHSDCSFGDFVEEIENNQQNRNLSAETIESTVQNSIDMLNSFNPERGE